MNQNALNCKISPLYIRRSTRIANDTSTCNTVLNSPAPIAHITVTEVHNNNLKKIAAALHVFNSIVLDDKLRWYSEELSRGYFSTPAEYASYMKIVHNKPMDFSTIRKKIDEHRYNDSHTLFSDMELVFKNAMAFNRKGGVWYDEAHRLHKLVLLLKNKKVIKLDKSPWFYQDALSRLCPQCNNILLPSKSSQARRCGDCSANICGERMDCFSCHNHTGSPHSFCCKCVKKWCAICKHWHVGNQCKNKHSDNMQISLQVPAKPHGIAAVDKFERIILKKNDTLKARMGAIIKRIKSLDIESHFFKEVQIGGYAATVTNPIHFGEILQRLNGNKYATMGRILRDVRLLWSNCYKFNGDPDADKGPTLFSNFAYELQCAMEEYIRQFEDNLIKQGWIRIDANVPQKRIAPLNKINKFENKSQSKTKKKNKKSVLIPKKRRNNASMPPTKKKKQLKHNESVTTDTKSTEKHIKSNKNIRNNKPEHTAVIAPNASNVINNNDDSHSYTTNTEKRANHCFAPELEGKYKLIGKTDHGGYATVYKAVDLSSKNKNNNIVAVKRVQSANIDTLHQNHPCIEAKILEEFASNIHFATLREILCDCSSGSYSIIMDYFEHEPFSQYNTMLNEEDSIGYIYVLLDCIHCLSLKGYIHRDIKPNNFLYSHKDRKYLLIDFGLCQSKKCVANTYEKGKKRRRSQSRYLRDGTPGFRAPEVILASNNQDSRIDVFSVGLILGSIMLGSNVIFNPINDAQQLLQFINVYGLHTVYETANALGRKLEIRGLDRERIYMNNGENCLNSGSYVTGYELPRQQRDSFKLSYWIKQRLKLKENVDITTKREWSADLYDLLDKLTQFNPFKRVTPYQALQHKLFSAFQPVGKLN